MISAAMSDAFARAFNARDLDALLALYEPEAVMYGVSTGRMVRGRPAIAAELRIALDAPGTRVNVNHRGRPPAQGIRRKPSFAKTASTPSTSVTPSPSITAKLTASTRLTCRRSIRKSRATARR